MTTNTQEYWTTFAIDAARQRCSGWPSETIDLLTNNWYGISKNWWVRTALNTNLNLSSAGHVWFADQAGLTPHRIVLKALLSGKQLLQLSRVFPSPFYVYNMQKIDIFGEMDIIMLALQDDDLQKYLNTLQS